VLQQVARADVPQIILQTTDARMLLSNRLLTNAAICSTLAPGRIESEGLNSRFNFADVSCPSIVLKMIAQQLKLINIQKEGM
jgi:hypothetical protein